MVKIDITAERLRELVHYDPETGLMRWKVSRGNRVPAGSIVGHKNVHGYWATRIGGKDYRVHRLVWFYVTGAFPKHLIDHIDGDRGNNRFENLRDVTHSANGQNKKRSRNNTTGFLGVIFEPSTGTFRARISIGAFATAEEAHKAYLAAKRILHPFGML